MSNALIQDLVQARLREQDEIAASKNAAILARLQVDPMSPFGMSAKDAHARLIPYVAFCQTAMQYPLSELPATPALVAYFVQEATLPVDELASILEVISRWHNEKSFADPTTSYLVTAAMFKKAKIDPPRSWPKDQHSRFQALPYDLQRYVVKREAERDREVRRVQNRANSGEKRETEAA